MKQLKPFYNKFNLHKANFITLILLSGVMFIIFFYNPFDRYEEPVIFDKASETLIENTIIAGHNNEPDYGDYGLGSYFRIDGKIFDNSSSNSPFAYSIKPYYKSIAKDGKSIIIHKTSYTNQYAEKGGLLLSPTGESWKIDSITPTENDDMLTIKLSGDTKLTQTESGLLGFKFQTVKGKVSPENMWINYYSSVGLQGYIAYFLADAFGLANGEILRVFTCLMLSIVLSAIVLLINKKYNSLLAFSFYIGFALSPWIASFSKSAYWCLYLMFIPLLISLALQNKFIKEKTAYILIFVAFFIKCLCGFEYITVIAASCVAFIVCELFSANKLERNILIKQICFIALSIFLAFLAAVICMGVFGDADSFSKNLNNFFEYRVLRRIMFADANMFSSAYTESINADFFKTLGLYFKFNTDVLYGIPAAYSQIFFALPVIALVLDYALNHKPNKALFILYIFFMLANISWFIFAKPHSFVHQHLNYVLMYFGFVQIAIYIPLKLFFNKIKELKT